MNKVFTLIFTTSFKFILTNTTQVINNEIQHRSEYDQQYDYNQQNSQQYSQSRQQIPPSTQQYHYTLPQQSPRQISQPSKQESPVQGSSQSHYSVRNNTKIPTPHNEKIKTIGKEKEKSYTPSQNESTQPQTNSDERIYPPTILQENVKALSPQSKQETSQIKDGTQPTSYSSSRSPPSYNYVNSSSKSQYIKGKKRKITPSHYSTPPKSVDSELHDEKHTPKRLKNEKSNKKTNELDEKLQRTMMDADRLLYKKFKSLLRLLKEESLGDKSTITTALWAPYLYNEEYERPLSDSMLVEIENILQKCPLEVLESINVKRLLNLEKLCCRSFNQALSINWKDSWQEQEDIDEVLKLLQVGENSMKAAMVVLRILLSGRSEKQLFVEDIVAPFIKLSFNIIEGLILPLASKATHEYPEFASIKRIFAGFVQQPCKVLELLREFVSLGEIDDTSITRLEFLTIMVIFGESVAKEKDSILGIANFEALRASSMELLCTIFRTKDDQKSFILDEILTNLEKLPVTKVMARQFKLTRGPNIQLVTALLVRLVHTFQTADFKFHNVPVPVKNRQLLSDKEQEIIKQDEEDFIEESKTAMSQSIGNANEISSFLIQRISKSGNYATYKHIFEMLIEDLQNVLTFPEWPAAETLLFTIVNSLACLSDNENTGSQMQSFALELLGNIGYKLISLKQKGSPIDLSPKMENAVFKKLSESVSKDLIFLQKLGIKEPSTLHAYSYQLLKWTNNICALKVELEDHESPQLSILVNEEFDKITKSIYESSWPDNGTDSDADIQESSINTYMEILLSQPLVKSYDHFLNLILRSLSHPKIKSRSRALKTLGLLISRDSSLLTLPAVRTSVSQRLIDNSALVRDSAVDLLGKYLTTKPEVAQEFYIDICDRSNDTSVGVRKRVVKILKDLYSYTDKIHIKVEVADRLLRRFNDEEDSIIELSMDVLTELWFVNLAQAKARSVQDDDMELKELTTKNTQIIIDTAAKNERNEVTVASFIEDIATIKDDDKKKTKSRELALTSFKLIIENLFEKIIEHAEDKEFLRKSMSLLSTISKFNATFITQDQLLSLQAYLTDDRSMDDTLCYYTLKIFRNSLNHVGALRPQFLQEAQLSLMKRLTKFNLKELGAAVPCLWIIALMRKDVRRVATAALSCLKILNVYVQKVIKKQPIVPDAKIARLLHLVGNLGRDCQFEGEKQLFLDGKVSMKPNEPVVALFMRDLLYFTGPELDHSIRRMAIKNVINICISHSQLLMAPAVLKVIDREFEGTDKDIKLVIIQGFISFLQFERIDDEEDTDGKNGENPTVKKVRKSRKSKSSKNTKLDVDVFHGSSSKYNHDGICSSLVQRFLPRILDLCLKDESEFSFTAVRFLEIVVRQGFANPRICSPTIIALEASSKRQFRVMATEMHRKLHEKYESLVENSYIEGIRLAVKYRKQVSTMFFDEKHFLELFYSVIGDARSSGKKFVTSITKAYNFSNSSISITESLELFDFVYYTVNNLTGINFSTGEEVYLLVNGLDRLIAGEGINMSLAITEQKKRMITPECTEGQSESQLQSQQELKDRWYKLSILSLSFILILHLRRHMISHYSMSESKCRDFIPGKADKELKQAPKLNVGTKFEITDVDINLSSEDEEKSIKICEDYLTELSLLPGTAADYSDFEENDESNQSQSQLEQDL